ncbi:hypothetical protein [Oleiagrimonas sp. C23AA]|uniref:hypothetical protein n=1 Tax=Oleiagrimonas sp. C23AA TaxID=2719047 RepID=UPI00141D9F19|nr:hypothetical protein [Oleiagrimonas sp. C23AA]NII10162.1 hypothetical protein [Oleiagrimonas sp. C23AA]
MKRNIFVSLLLLGAGFGAGILACHVPAASAATQPKAADLAHQVFVVSVDELRQRFVVNHPFKGSYRTTVTLSDGSQRSIELVPMVHRGTQVVELKDNGHHTYMGLNGSAADGKLLVRVRDVAILQRELREQGWRGITR